MQAERSFIDWVRRAATAAAGGARPELRLGIGDDAALFGPRRGHELALTTDLFIEDVHFLRDRDPAESCGHRLATRALSDLAAMGAEPLGLLLSCAFPAQLPDRWPRALYRGVLAALSAAGAGLAGGDVAAAPHGKIMLDVVGLGQVPNGKALRRSGARPGDGIYVSGTLGAAALGRHLAHTGARPANREQRQAVARHRRPQARWQLGMALRGIATAALDISDGLGTDLHHLCRESAVGAIVDASLIPRPHHPQGMEWALCGGEDYELLVTIPPRRGAPTGLTRIGIITKSRSLWLQSPQQKCRLGAIGWQHFDPAAPAG